MARKTKATDPAVPLKLQGKSVFLAGNFYHQAEGLQNLIKLEGKNAAGMLRLIDAMEEHDDVQNVYSNFDIDERELAALEK